MEKRAPTLNTQIQLVVFLVVRQSICVFRINVVIDCVGMSGNMTPLEFLANGLSLQGGAMELSYLQVKLFEKGGTIQITGVYGASYIVFPLDEIFQRNVTI